MHFKKKISVFILGMLIFHSAKSTTWVTVSSGYWNSPSVWSSGVVPPHSSSDTFHIKHPIIITSSLAFNSNALFQIDSFGGICGHYTVTCSTGARIIKFGILELDSLLIPGGMVNCYPPGQVILTWAAIIWNSGALNSYGSSLAVGPWFNCVQPAYSFEAGIEEISGGSFSISPNPLTFQTTLTFSEEQKNILVKITDVLGKEIRTINFSGKELIIEKGEMGKGIYFVEITSSPSLFFLEGGRKPQYGKLIIQ